MPLMQSACCHSPFNDYWLVETPTSHSLSTASPRSILLPFYNLLSAMHMVLHPEVQHVDQKLARGILQESRRLFGRQCSSVRELRLGLYAEHGSSQRAERDHTDGKRLITEEKVRFELASDNPLYLSGSSRKPENSDIFAMVSSNPRRASGRRERSRR